MHTKSTITELKPEVIAHCLKQTNLPLGKKTTGKVRDIYDLGDKVILISTDRLSAFDRQIALIPNKGQVLNSVSAWWFQQSAHLVPNHLLAIPDPNVMIVRKCEVFPIEFVVRGYITGTTDTSLWKQYSQGVRNYCGIDFPEGLQKNQPLAQPVLTPTTKEAVHDRPISPAEIVKEGWMNQQDWDEASKLALKLYQFGVEQAQKHGLILVDTKYEFGRDAQGKIRVIDEIHTPDSSRYWLASSYQHRLAQNLEPENIDKEFLRLWFAKNCDPYAGDLPEAPLELVLELSKRYCQLYELITNKQFDYPIYQKPLEQRILDNLTAYLEN